MRDRIELATCGCSEKAEDARLIAGNHGAVESTEKLANAAVAVAVAVAAEAEAEVVGFCC